MIWRLSGLLSLLFHSSGRGAFSRAAILDLDLTNDRDFGLKGASVKTTDAFAANIVSLLQAGCFFGSLLAAPLGDKLGRRITLMITGIVFSAGSLCQVLSFGSTTAMFVGRAIGGLVSNPIPKLRRNF